MDLAPFAGNKPGVNGKSHAAELKFLSYLNIDIIGTEMTQTIQSNRFYGTPRCEQIKAYLYFRRLISPPPCLLILHSSGYSNGIRQHEAPTNVDAYNISDEFSAST
jgi:hypothetical protein